MCVGPKPTRQTKPVALRAPMSVKSSPRDVSVSSSSPSKTASSFPSVSSTTTTTSSRIPSSSKIDGDRTKSKKKVHFALLQEDDRSSFSNNDYDYDDDDDALVQVEIMGPLLTPSSEMTTLEKSQVWWNELELRQFKTDAQSISSTIRRSLRLHEEKADSRSDYWNEHCAYAGVLMIAYSSCLNDKTTPTFSEGKEEEEQRNVLLQEHLTYWAKNAECCRGLERWNIPQMARDRVKRKRSLIQGVVQIQSFDEYAHCTNEQRAEALQLASERLSRPARLYARSMGEADAAAAAAAAPVGLKRESSSSSSSSSSSWQMVERTESPRSSMELEDAWVMVPPDRCTNPSPPPLTCSSSSSSSSSSSMDECPTPPPPSKCECVTPAHHLHNSNRKKQTLSIYRRYCRCRCRLY